jgi:CelD/BcsL family acetyltransferase involved in cellulose biosynthesis
VLRGHGDLQLYQCSHDGELVALAIVSSATIRRRKLFSSRTISLNEVARVDLNMVIEYNGLLALPGYESRALQQLVDDLAAQRGWDEVQLTHIPQGLWLGLRAESTDARLMVDEEHRTWVAPLDPQTDLESLYRRMSSNRRSKIRRSFKEYEKEGALTIDAASTAEQALTYFRELGVLHTHRWNRVGVGGSFAQAAWVAFHEDLISSAFALGHIQLLRIRCGERPIGYLYNFLWRGAVLMLQSGFASETSNILRPGYVSHMLAMQLNARAGATSYDFLIGDSEYKTVLAEPLAPLVSGRLQRRRLKFVLENTLVDIYRRTRRPRTEPQPSPAESS